MPKTVKHCVPRMTHSVNNINLNYGGIFELIFCMLLSVPSAIDEKTFWTRYFFRVYQIEKDEEKRKALLAGNYYSSLLFILLI